MFENLEYVSSISPNLFTKEVNSQENSGSLKGVLRILLRGNNRRKGNFICISQKFNQIIL